MLFGFFCSCLHIHLAAHDHDNASVNNVINWAFCKWVLKTYSLWLSADNIWIGCAQHSLHICVQSTASFTPQLVLTVGVNREIFAVLEAMPQLDKEDYYLTSKGFSVEYDSTDNPIVQEQEAEAAALRSGKGLDSAIPESDSNDETSDREPPQDSDDEVISLHQKSEARGFRGHVRRYCIPFCTYHHF